MRGSPPNNCADVSQDTEVAGAAEAAAVTTATSDTEEDVEAVGERMC